ncbi:hypothetical protein Bca4012_085076 [Brassica carinata]
MAGRGRGGKRKSQQRKSTKRNRAPVEELSGHGNESDHQSASSERCKRMKAMEKKLGKIEKEMKEIKEKEKDNYEGFDYQGMDYEWDGQRNDSNADMVEPEGQKIDEKESEEEPEVEAEEAEKDDIGSEEEKEPDEVAEEAEKNDIAGLVQLRTRQSKS